MTNLDSTLKSRDITLPTKVRLVKAMVFPVDMYGCENWTIKNAQYQRIDGFVFLFVCLFVFLVFYFLNFKIFNSYMRSQT